jgi:hypothetical protein
LKLKVTTKQLTLVAIFSALFAIFRLIPMGPMIGLSASFSLSESLAPLFGIILGPFAGGISVIIGTFTAVAMGKPVVFLGLDFLPAFVNAIAVGFLIRRKWIPVATLYTILLVAFTLSPYSLLIVQVGSIPVPFLWMHIVALALMLSPIGFKAISNVKKSNIAFLAGSIALITFVGTMLQHLTGNLLFQLILGEPIGGMNSEAFNTVWSVIFYAYPIERIVLVIIAVIIGVPIVKILKKSILPFEDPTIDKPKLKR